MASAGEQASLSPPALASAFRAPLPLSSPPLCGAAPDELSHVPQPFVSPLPLAAAAFLPAAQAFAAAFSPRLLAVLAGASPLPQICEQTRPQLVSVATSHFHR
eukprot:CAMPEP_0197660888 /NCGR_PEP_ID=MMETSP1338-20131121/51123_1 /TAXON_ID=43686 ORGANISM="Pelagodinium beii, Strain RCC1491" /NCGR_SAMPLE_ID=MMETSP1338 /ASSEMBLY_ACC=CAM_ASM_000754 /LENGTH=102 /DNA_ID=CAMNT_0043238335 /DNA_START=483 /DNA_END=791 /DNA_ORIENTATION=+